MNKKEYCEIQRKIGRKGGQKTLEKHGKKHFSKISKDYQDRMRKEREEHQLKVEAYIKKNEQRKLY